MEENLSTKKPKLIIFLVILFFALAGSGGYLLWRTNQSDSLSPDYTEASSVQTIQSACMEDAYGSKLNCTANDVSVVNVTEIQILDDGCTSHGDTVSFTANWELRSNAVERYNVGLYFPTSGQNSALKGMCSVSTLPTSPVPPWYNFDNNVCGDISSSASVFPQITLTVVCLDTNGDGNLNLPYCTSWHQQNYTCNSPLDAIPLTSSKCNCDDSFSIAINVPPPEEPPIEEPTTDYTVKYDGNGGTCPPTSRVVESGGKADAPTCENSGYTLVGFTITDNPENCASGWNSSTGYCGSVIGDFTVMAEWEIITFTIIYIAGPNGSVTGNKSQVVNYGASGTEVTAVPNSEYYFSGWSDASASKSRTEVNVISNLEFTASFSQSCGDGYCDLQNETSFNCPVDCPAVCGDGLCTHDENETNCPQDCLSTVAKEPEDPPVQDPTPTSPVEPSDEPQAPITDQATMPETSIFDSTQSAVMMGLGLLLLGISWKAMDLSFRFLIERKRISNRKKFEKRVIRK